MQQSIDLDYEYLSERPRISRLRSTNRTRLTQISYHGSALRFTNETFFTSRQITLDSNIEQMIQQAYGAQNENHKNLGIVQDEEIIKEISNYEKISKDEKMCVVGPNQDRREFRCQSEYYQEQCDGYFRTNDYEHLIPNSQ